MKQQTQQEKLKSIGISMLALGFFPLIWFLFQAILFRELTEIISRNLLVVFALIIGSTFVFLLFLGMDKIIKLSEHFKRFKKDKHSTLGLAKSVNKRKKLLAYLKKKNSESYQKVIKQLNLRK